MTEQETEKSLLPILDEPTWLHILSYLNIRILDKIKAVNSEFYRLSLDKNLRAQVANLPLRDYTRHDATKTTIISRNSSEPVKQIILHDGIFAKINNKNNIMIQLKNATGNIVTICEGANILIWDGKTGDCLHFWQRHHHFADKLRLLALADGKFAITGTANHMVEIWDETGCLHEIPWKYKNENEVTAICALPNHQMAIGLKIGVVCIFDYLTGKEVNKFLLPNRDEQQSLNNQVTALCDLSHNQVAIGLKAGIILILNYLTCKELNRIRIRPVDGIEVLPYGNLKIRSGEYEYRFVFDYLYNKQLS